MQIVSVFQYKLSLIQATRPNSFIRKVISARIISLYAPEGRSFGTRLLKAQFARIYQEKNHGMEIAW